MRKPKQAVDGSDSGEISADEIAAILAGSHANPFAVLGVQEAGGGFVARCFIPGAEAVTATTLDGTVVGELECLDSEGFFAGPLTLTKLQPVRYRARRGDVEWAVTDPYSFGPVLGPMDDYYARQGSHLRLFDKLGAHPLKHEGAQGFHFAVWAPNAQRVSVVGDFNNWDGRRHAMRFRSDSGIWEIFAPDVPPGVTYKFEIRGHDGVLLPLKADPFARRSELRPKTASMTAPELVQKWDDEAHRQFWSETDKRRQPISIYEVHAASWQRHHDGTMLSWDELASRLIPYCVDMGFTHIEFLPITEHPTIRRGDTRRPGSTPRRRASGSRKVLPASSTAATRSASASSSTGSRHISRRTNTGSAGSTARRFTSMPTPARASTRTGARRSTISAARRSHPTWSTTRSTGRRSFISTGCASMPWLRCSISTTRASTASGSPTNMAATKIWRPSVSSRP